MAGMQSRAAGEEQQLTHAALLRSRAQAAQGTNGLLHTNRHAKGFILVKLKSFSKGRAFSAALNMLIFS